jgi:AraC-like DNA-binding protein
MAEQKIAAAELRKIDWLAGSPLGIAVYAAGELPTRVNDDLLEIIFCLRGSVKFSYVYEEFTLNPGEYISVDKDAYFLTDGSADNLCASVYLDLPRYREQYPYILTTLFICEGCESAMSDYPQGYPAGSHQLLKGLLISLLAYFCGRTEIPGRTTEEVYRRYADALLELLVTRFTIFHYYLGETIADRRVHRMMQKMAAYLYEHAKEDLTIRDLAREFNYSPGYVSKFLRSSGVSFRNQLIYLRAIISERYLLFSDMTIAAIAEECGFSDPKYFYRAMRRLYGCTPKEFREYYRRSRETRIEMREATDIAPCLDGILERHYYSLFQPDFLQKRH